MDKDIVFLKRAPKVMLFSYSRGDSSIRNSCQELIRIIQFLKAYVKKVPPNLSLKSNPIYWFLFHFQHNWINYREEISRNITNGKIQMFGKHLFYSDISALWTTLASNSLKGVKQSKSLRYELIKEGKNEDS